jgi:hypothetical protein
MIEFKMCKNECGVANYGRQLEITKTRKKFRDSEVPHMKKKDMDEEQKKEFFSTRSNKLLCALAKYCYDDFDMAYAEEKEAIVIPIIVEGTEEVLLENRARILKYCADDVRLLRKLGSRMFKLQHNNYEASDTKVSYSRVLHDAEVRGRVSAHYAVIRYRGIPIHRAWSTQIGQEAQNIIAQIAKETNAHLAKFIESLPDGKAPIKRAKEEGFVQFDLKKRQWTSGRGLVLSELLTQNYDTLCDAIGQPWPKTEKGAVSADKKFVEKLLANREPNSEVEVALAFGPKTSVLRKLDLHGSSEFDEEYDSEETNDYEFDTKSFWGCLSKGDFRSRSPFFPMSTQSSRCTPSTTSHPTLLPKWLRTIMQPPKGKVIFDVDFSSQEFLLQAIWANDINMLNAYLSGDVYMATGESFSIVPKGANKKNYVLERQALKAIVLGLGFGLGRKSLDSHIRNEMGAVNYVALINKLEAEGKDTNFWQMFQEAYPQLAEKRREVMQNEELICRLPYTGFTMWKDNPNPLSKANVFVQGIAASILYACIENLKHYPIVWSLHDALAFELPIDTWRVQGAEIMKIMIDTFNEVTLKGHPWAPIKNGTGIRAEVDCWGFGLECKVEKGTIGNELRTSPVFVDPRGVKDTLKYGLTAFPKDDFFQYILPTCEMHAEKITRSWSQKLDGLDYLRATL